MSSEFHNINDWKAPASEHYEDYIEYSSQVMPDINLVSEYVLGKSTEMKSEEESDSDGYDLVSNRPRIYIPGKVYFAKDKESRLNKCQQAICLHILKHFKMGGTEGSMTETEKYDYEIYKSLLNDIHQENADFITHAKHDWDISKKSHLRNIHEVICKHAEKAWRIRLNMRLFYPRYYKFENEMISLSYEEKEPKVLVNLLHHVGHFGRIAEFLSPKVFLERYLHWGFPNLSKRHTLNSKLPVSQDNHIETFIKDHDFDVVATASTLTKLMDDTDYNSNWDIPVVVKTHTVGGKSKKVVYIDKPLPKKHPNQLDFMTKSFKDLIRTSYCRFPSVCFPLKEDLRLNPKHISFKKVEENVKLGSMENLQNIEDDNKSNGFTQLELKSDRKRRAGSLPPNYTYQPAPKKTKIVPSEWPIINSTIIHNVNYKIWSVALTPTENQLLKQQASKAEIKFLVRCKVDACEPYNKNEINKEHTADIGPGEAGSPLKPLVIIPKIEHQIKLGANISTKSEVIKQWSALFFRPHSELKKVRITSCNREVVAIDSVQLPMVNHEGMSYYKYKPVLRLGVLHKVFSKLLTLEDGNYLLHHKAKQGYFVNVLRAEKSDFQFNESTNINSYYNLHFEYKKKNCGMIPVKEVPWCSIDVHYILPQHIAYKRMPGMFAPAVLAPKLIKRKKNAQKAKRKKVKHMLKQQGECGDHLDIF